MKTTVAELKAAFDRQISAEGKVVLDDAVLEVKASRALLGSTGHGKLTLLNAQLTLHENGSSKTLEVRGSAEGDWGARGLNGLRVAAPSISLLYTERDALTTDGPLRIEGKLSTGQPAVTDGHAIPCQGSVLDDGTLHFVLRGEQAIRLPLADLANLASGNRMSAEHVPQVGGVFDGVPLTALDLRFGLGQNASSHLSISSDVGGPWEFVRKPGFPSLTSVGARLFSSCIVFPNLKPRKTFGGDIHADFVLAGHPVEVRLAMSDAASCELDIVPVAEGRLPGLLDLADALEVKAAVQTALNALSLGDIAVASVAIGFNPAAREFEYLSVVGRVQIAGVDFDLFVSLPDFQFGGGLARGSTISFRKLVQHYFDAADNFPDVIVEEFALSAHPSAGTYALTVDLREEGFAVGPLRLDGLNLFIEKTPQGFDGSMSATLAIAGTIVNVSVERPTPGDGWQFKGGTAEPGKIPVSRFVADTLDQLFPSSHPGPTSIPPLLDVAIDSFHLDFNTKSRDFHFDTELAFGQGVKTALTFSNLHQVGSVPATFEKRATGSITVFPGTKSEFAFALGLDLASTSKHFVGLFNNTAGSAIQLGDLVKAMAPAAEALSGIPNFGVTIKDAIVGYVSKQQDGKAVSQAIFGLDLGASIDLSSLGDIPLVGKSLTAAKTLKLAVQLVYPAIAAGASFSQADLADLNRLITGAGPRLPADQALTGLFVKTELRIGDGKPIDFELPIKIDPSSGQLVQTPATGAGANLPGSQATDDGVQWLQLDKQFGPVHLQRVGLKFADGKLTALLDGGISAAGLELDLMGLSVSSTLTGVTDGHFSPEFALNGLGLKFSKGGVAIAGALLHVQRKVGDQAIDEYDGMAAVELETLRLAAIGSLSTVADQPSLFVYAVLDYPLGGTPFFYVTGLAGGFGLNRQLVLPKVTEVSTFPLVTAAMNPPAMPTDPSTAGAFITAQMKKLETSLVPHVGQFFGCAGVRFTSFELLDSFVLVSLSFGQEFELDLLGVSTLVVPPKQAEGSPALAVISLQLAASFIPDQGLAIVQGQLSRDSHIFDANCHVTGGFALASWFGVHPQAGDFVVTLGGYHPDFVKPAHYPSVPRIGVNWQISPHLSVTGGLYFALTPRALMAGGAMHALFQLDLDLAIATVKVKAWFLLGADFLVYWKPFHYSARVYIDIGIDVVLQFFGTHQLGFDAGAELEVWGPPFAGHAHVSLKVIGIKIGFNVDFGETAPLPPPLSWQSPDAAKSFRQSFLPPDQEIVSLAIASGLERRIELPSPNAALAAAQGSVWHVINPKDFCVRTSSVVPIKTCDTSIHWVDQKTGLADFGANTAFGIASMGKGEGQVNTAHQITVMRDREDASSAFLLRPIMSHVPGGLWAESNSADLNAAALVENVVTGFELVPAIKPTSGHSQAIARDLLAYSTHLMADAFVDQPIAGFAAAEPDPGDDLSANRAIWERLQRDVHQNAQRDAVLSALGFTRTDLDIGAPFAADAAYAPKCGVLRAQPTA